MTEPQEKSDACLVLFLGTHESMLLWKQTRSAELNRPDFKLELGFAGSPSYYPRVLSFTKRALEGDLIEFEASLSRL